MSALPCPDPAEPFDAFQWAVAWVLRMEGGFANDPDDHGGATKFGITQATYNAWRKRLGLAIAPVAELSLQTSKAIYKRGYWDACRCDEIAATSAKMSLCVFDAAVQSGVKVASLTFQRVARAQPDGVIGPKALAAFRIRRQEVTERLMLEAFMDRRRGYYATIIFEDRTQQKFARGWKHRRNSLRSMIGLEPEEV